MNYNIVVAHYNENLNWLSCFDKNSIIVYSKGKSSEIDCIQKFLPNVGREAHTYLTYILENYDNFPDIIFFTQGDISEHKITIDKEIINNTFLNIKTHSQNYNICPFKSGLNHDWHLRNYKNSNLTRFKLSGLEFFRTYINKSINIHNEICWYSGAIFSVTKEMIKTRSRDYYQILYLLINKDNNPEIAHFFERSWYYIFNLDKINSNNSIKMDK